jgi:hypothetical protein
MTNVLSTVRLSGEEGVGMNINEQPNPGMNQSPKAKTKHRAAVRQAPGHGRGRTAKVAPRTPIHQGPVNKSHPRGKQNG